MTTESIVPALPICTGMFLVIDGIVAQLCQIRHQDAVPDQMDLNPVAGYDNFFVVPRSNWPQIAAVRSLQTVYAPLY